MKNWWLVVLLLLTQTNSFSQVAAQALVEKIKVKMAVVTDYSATGKLKTDVAFLKVPVAKVNVYFKKPNKFRITKEKGISIMPKGGVSINMQDILSGDKFLALDAGTATINGTNVRVVKILPVAEGGDVVLTTLYIDEQKMLINKMSTTTKENGTYDVTLTYGKWSNYSLPDKTVFSFNTKDYKLPKGVTMEFDDGERPDSDKLKNKKGTVEITYETYIINKGVPDSFFPGTAK